MQATQAIPKLLAAARSNEARFFIQFGGQGGSFLYEAQILKKNYPELGKFFDTACAAVEDFLARESVGNDRRVYPVGFDLRSWLNGMNEPDADALGPCATSFPGNQIAQLAYYHLLNLRGYPLPELLSYTKYLTGHSQGLQAAVAAAIAAEGEGFYQVVYDFVHWFAAAGYRAQNFYGFDTLTEPELAMAREHDSALPTPMAAVTGASDEALLDITSKYNREFELENGILISLDNTPDLKVITGRTGDILRFRRHTFPLFREKGWGFAYVNVSAPFHRNDFYEDHMHIFYADPACLRFPYTGRDLKIPVISCFDQKNLQEEERLAEIMADIMLMRPVYWGKTIQAPLADPSVTHILDFGPGKISVFLTKAFLQNSDKKILSIVGRSGLRQFLETW